MKRLISLVLLCVVLGAGGAQAQESSGVSDERFARLGRGVNLAFWFWYAPEDVEARFGDDEFTQLREMGITFVRLPIDLGYVMDSEADDLLRAEGVADLDRALDRLLAADLAVVIDLHSTSIDDSNAANYSGALEDPAFVDVFIRFWQAFAGHLSERDPEMVFLGPMNEPVFEADPSQWPPIQARLLAAIREAAPENTLIATGALWSNMDTLLALEPLDDPNIVYDFHFYEPFLFTHQGATWTWYVVHSLRDIPYPSSPEAVERILAGMNNEEIKGHVRQYGEERWDAARIEARIQQAADWAAEHGVRLICTEFGAYGAYSELEDRVAWLHDTRAAFEKFGIGWSMWEYDDSFGLVIRMSNGVVVIPSMAEALGLDYPER